MKKQKYHGISIGIERLDDELFLYFKAVGRLTHEDYEQLTPLIESALEQVEKPRIKALFDARDFEGWDLRAAWDDLKFSLKHGREFSKVAVVGDEKWQEMLTRIAGWFFACEVDYFSEYGDALAWLAKPAAPPVDVPVPHDEPSFPRYP